MGNNTSENIRNGFIVGAEYSGSIWVNVIVGDQTYIRVVGAERPTMLDLAGAEALITVLKNAVKKVEIIQRELGSGGERE